MRSGMTLLELLLVIALLAMLGTVSAGLYYSLKYATDIEEDRNSVMAVLRTARGYAVSGEQALPWGVRFDHTDASNPAYVLFAGTSFAGSATTMRYTLAPGVTFGTPPVGQTLDVVFTRRTGATSPVTIRLRLQENILVEKTITVSAQGLIAR